MPSMKDMYFERVKPFILAVKRVRCEGERHTDIRNRRIAMGAQVAGISNEAGRRTTFYDNLLAIPAKIRW